MGQDGTQQVGVLTVGLLREIFRNLTAFRSTYEAHGIDEVHGPSGLTINLHDIEYLYSQLHRLPFRQAQAIELFLVQGHREVEVAKHMGVSPTNPIGMYATSGLSRLLQFIAAGELERFKPESAWLGIDPPAERFTMVPVAGSSRTRPVPRFRRLSEVIESWLASTGLGTEQSVAI